MLVIKTFNEKNKPSTQEKEQIVDFLFANLEQYGDPRQDILKCADYALKEGDSFGGCINAAYQDNEVVGAVIVNKTGMKDYIPENILVYIATDAQKRGQGIGKTLMKKTIDSAEGDIALHVEPDNPAKGLYESLGFTNKYLEMRLKKH
ncbi:GNAT family N-acetyltransferase [Crocinitomicaceae bacterium CZZ-1]|uniref:GNAT family N-acetyltransferase n=1 Tax=Taishania pollutisoli TaxID=2766479 RepID=A0A8J6TS94_9FLAO|nr:GNAT family N-acetyltransferase [Taishania pollutisoli]MBC9811932.1 GNAT family N-acetyltransferase [Taishania pollutisoli]MBX2949994.1 GNAT family N-acetyltransferase [Crocinitomicaceae bacterium]NGF74913.1 GNAT family N-acetyltransferase [Fluviicola sp. SGL-29]